MLQSRLHTLAHTVLALTAATEHDKFHNVGGKKVFCSLRALKGKKTNKEAFALAGVNLRVCIYVFMCVSLSNYTSSLLQSAFNYILFVPLGAEGPVNCLELCAASSCCVTRLHSRRLIQPRRGLRG